MALSVASGWLQLPATHPRISEKERHYIEESIAAQGHDDMVHFRAR